MKIVAMICADRNGAADFRAEKRGGMAGSAVRTAQMVAACPHTGESVPGARVSRWEAQSPAAQPRQEGVTETWVSVEMGPSKTVPPASIREETSSLPPRSKSRHRTSWKMSGRSSHSGR